MWLDEILTKNNFYMHFLFMKQISSQSSFARVIFDHILLIHICTNFFIIENSHPVFQPPARPHHLSLSWDMGYPPGFKKFLLVFKAFQSSFWRVFFGWIFGIPYKVDPYSLLLRYSSFRCSAALLFAALSFDWIENCHKGFSHWVRGRVELGLGLS